MNHQGEVLKSDKFDQLERMQWSSNSSSTKGPKRLCIFCLLAIFLPVLCLVVPIYMRFQALRPHFLTLSPSDMKLLNQESMVSTFWCESQKISMNSSFNAYILKERPQIKRFRQKVSMKRQMVLKDDIKEYWGFYLLKGSEVKVQVCARYPGANFIVVESLINAKRCDYLGELDSLEEVDEKSSEFEFDPSSAMPNQNMSIMDPHGYILENISKPYTDSNGTRNDSMITDNYVTERKLLDQYLSLFRSIPHQKRQILLRRIADALNNNMTLEPLEDRRERDIGEEYDFGGGEELDREDEEEEESRIFELIKNDRINQENRNGNVDLSMEEFASSWSSSEEALQNCNGLLHNVPLTPSIECHINGSIKSASTEVTLRVSQSGFYYFIFASENEIQDNNLFATFQMKKTVFDIDTHRLESYMNQTNCELPLRFWSKDQIILEAPPKNSEEFNDCDDISAVSSLPQCHRVIMAESICVPRTYVYTVLLLMAPMFILIFASI
ncbi:uncharacterized protein [Lepeophtheirus salmonis]|uniref:uncharacterized protein n=1 Tax=Lepeophtheirus salmonis TaxID=72036 RepID=UPI001AE9850E|nr:uncharacterized protein LOC121120596 [Lepeophtheirus salmonis]